MTDIETETYKVNRRTGIVHIAYGGRVLERCNTDQIEAMTEVAALEDIGSVTRRKVRFCKWCRPEAEL